MIARIWHGRTRAVDADRYADFLRQRAAPDYASVPGLQGLYFMRRIEGEVAHFQLLTLWESMAAIRAFAGERPELAKYYPEDDGFLLEKEPAVAHYELFHAG